MSVEVMKDRSVLSNKRVDTYPVELNLEYRLLDPSDEALLVEAAECLAETFAGTSINGSKVSEPMTNACSLTKEDMFEFVMAYLTNVAEQGLCYVAKEKETGKVIGAVACEDFNPNEEIPVFEGNLAPLNTIVEFLTELDVKLVNTIELKTSAPITKNEYVHVFMCGVRMEKYKKYVFVRLLELVAEDSCKKGYKGVFCEATNHKAIKLITDYCGWHSVYDESGNPIQSIYAENDTFKVIPIDVATDCRILYKPLSFEYDI